MRCHYFRKEGLEGASNGSDEVDLGESPCSRSHGSGGDSYGGLTRIGDYDVRIDRFRRFPYTNLVSCSLFEGALIVVIVII